MGVELVELSAEDGSILGRYSTAMNRFDDTSSLAIECKLFELWNGERRLVLWTASELCVFDLKLGEKVFDRSLGPAISVVDAWLGTQSIVLQQRVASSTKFVPYSLSTGEALESPLSKETVDSSLGSPATLAGERQDTLVLKCYDGLLRAYALSNGSMLWESGKETKVARFLEYVGDDRLVLQDALGRCILLDSTNGRFLANSPSILPEMLECGRRANGDGVATFIYRMKAPVKGTGLAVFRLDADNFGPISDVRYGLYLSKDGKKVLCNEPWMDSYVAYPRYDLADMIRQADRIIDDFDFKEE